MSIVKLTGCFSCKQPARNNYGDQGFMKVKFIESAACKKQSRFNSDKVHSGLIFFVPIRNLNKNKNFDQV